MIAIVDYGMGNLRSVAKAMEHVAPAETVRITAESAVVDAADRVVFPGQGAMPDCMRYLRESGLETAVRRAAAASRCSLSVSASRCCSNAARKVIRRVSDFSQARVVRFRDEAMRAPDGSRLKVPHMGWNRVRQTQPHPLWDGVDDGSWFYFVHSYHVVPADERLNAGISDYGDPFTCAVARDNIFATQFHPEKSAAAGLRIYENFCRWAP